MKKTIKSTLFLLYFFLTYTLIFGVFVFNLPLVSPTTIEYDVESMKQPSDETLYAFLLERGDIALDARLALIEAATETIHISYYTIHGGMGRDLYFGALLEAAERGVEIQIIIDDIFYRQTRDHALPYNALMAHDRVTFKLYEPYKPHIPPTIQNRLHDKLMMVDDTYGMIGGRNIGDRYFHFPGVDTSYTHDRDVLVFGDESIQPVKEMNAYYEELFNSQFSVEHTHDLTTEIRAEQQRMVDAFIDYQTHHLAQDTLASIHLSAHEIDNATFLRGPLTRMHKDPVVLRTISELAMHYDYWFVQSPYIIFSSLMNESLPVPTDETVIEVLVNTPALSPNTFAMSGYVRYRTLMAEVASVYEYQGNHSLHGKSMIFGEEISVIGTLNLDPRSATLSTESMMVIYSESFTHDFMQVIEGYKAESLILNPDETHEPNHEVQLIEMPFQRRVVLRAVSYITSLFDAML